MQTESGKRRPASRGACLSGAGDGGGAIQMRSPPGVVGFPAGLLFKDNDTLRKLVSAAPAPYVAHTPFQEEYAPGRAVYYSSASLRVLPSLYGNDLNRKHSLPPPPVDLSSTLHFLFGPTCYLFDSARCASWRVLGPELLKVSVHFPRRAEV